MKYVYTVLIGFVFWNFSYLAYSTLYGLTLVFGMPEIAELNLIVKIVLAPLAFYFAYKVVLPEFNRREQQKKELSKKKASQK